MSVDIQSLSVTLGSVQIVHDVNVHIANGERVGLVGASGSGKSMIAKAMLGLLPVDAHVTGSLMLGDVNTANASERTLADVRGRYVGTVFQNPGSALNPVLPVVRQIELPLKLHYNLNATERYERAMTMLHKVGLDDDIARAYPHQLSGGQQQRVGIATALVTAPRLIIADEPTTALDSITQRQIVDLLVSLVDDAGASMLFITHDFAVLSRATTRSYVLDRGEIVESGDTEQLLTHPQSAHTRELVHAARELTLRATQTESAQNTVLADNSGMSSVATGTLTSKTEEGRA